jgi:FAD binding domain
MTISSAKFSEEWKTSNTPSSKNLRSLPYLYLVSNNMTISQPSNDEIIYLCEGLNLGLSIEPGSLLSSFSSFQKRSFLIWLIRHAARTNIPSYLTSQQHSISASVMAGLLGLLGLGNLLSTSPPKPSMAACSALARDCPAITVTYPSGAANANYQYATDHYWSNTNKDGTPACVIFPTSAEDVSSVIRILLQYPTVPFAVKSGGHNANAGFSSVDGGVLISFQNSHDTVLSADEKTAEVGPGARWMDAVGALEPYGLTVVGGRLGMVQFRVGRNTLTDNSRRCWCWRLALGLWAQLSECSIWSAMRQQ